jgi:hypothetical protein
MKQVDFALSDSHVVNVWTRSQAYSGLFANPLLLVHNEVFPDAGPSNCGLSWLVSARGAYEPLWHFLEQKEPLIN